MSVKKQRVFFFEQVITKLLLLGHIDKKKVYIWYIYKDLNFRLSREKQKKKNGGKKIKFSQCKKYSYSVAYSSGCFFGFSKTPCVFFLQKENKTAQKKRIGKTNSRFYWPFLCEKVLNNTSSSKTKSGLNYSLLTSSSSS